MKSLVTYDLQPASSAKVKQNNRFKRTMHMGIKAALTTELKCLTCRKMSLLIVFHESELEF